MYILCFLYTCLWKVSLYVAFYFYWLLGYWFVVFNLPLLTLIFTNILPLYALRLQMPSAVVLIYSIDVQSRLMICYFLILLIDNFRILKQSLCYLNMEFFDNGAICDTSLIRKRTFSIVLKTHTPHYIQHGVCNLYSLVYELMTMEKSLYSLMMCYRILCYWHYMLTVVSTTLDNLKKIPMFCLLWHCCDRLFELCCLNLWSYNKSDHVTYRMYIILSPTKPLLCKYI